MTVINCHPVVVRISTRGKPNCLFISKKLCEQPWVNSLAINCLFFNSEDLLNVVSVHEFLQWSMHKHNVATRNLCRVFHLLFSNPGHGISSNTIWPWKTNFCCTWKIFSVDQVNTKLFLFTWFVHNWDSTGEETKFCFCVLFSPIEEIPFVSRPRFLIIKFFINCENLVSRHIFDLTTSSPSPRDSWLNNKLHSFFIKTREVLILRRVNRVPCNHNQVWFNIIDNILNERLCAQIWLCVSVVKKIIQLCNCESSQSHTKVSHFKRMWVSPSSLVCIFPIFLKNLFGGTCA